MPELILTLLSWALLAAVAALFTFLALALAAGTIGETLRRKSPAEIAARQARQEIERRFRKPRAPGAIVGGVAFVLLALLNRDLLLAGHVATWLGCALLAFMAGSVAHALSGRHG